MKLGQKNPLDTSVYSDHYSDQMQFQIVTCYNCQENFFQVTFAVKSINFCAVCWSK